MNRNYSYIHGTYKYKYQSPCPNCLAKAPQQRFPFRPPRPRLWPHPPFLLLQKMDKWDVVSMYNVKCKLSTTGIILNSECLAIFNTLDIHLRCSWESWAFDIQLRLESQSKPSEWNRSWSGKHNKDQPWDLETWNNSLVFSCLRLPNDFTVVWVVCMSLICLNLEQAQRAQQDSLFTSFFRAPLEL